jgi:uncharacterized membrane protein YgdD (TMEM256/DUF423 family)
MGKKPFDTGLTVAAGAVSAGLAVAFGAFGAHLLAERLPADLLAVYETAARYHFYHSLGLLAVGLLTLHRQRAARSEPPRLRWSAALMLTGIVLFSGSLYTMALTGQRWLGAVTPFGGAAFLLAWGLLAWEALAGRGGSVMGLARGPCG